MMKANRGLMTGICFLAGLGVAAAQGVANAGTAATNEVPEAGLPIVTPVITNPAPPPQPTQILFSTPAIVTTPTPTVPGSGQLGSPLLGTSVFGGAPPTGAANFAGPALYQSGPINVHAQVSYGFTYGTEIESAPGQRVNTLLNAVTPDILVNWGPHWTLQYTPAFDFYSADGLTDSTSQLLSLRGFGAYNDWVFGLLQTYSSQDTVLVETGQQTSLQSYETVLTAARQLGSHWSLNLGADQSFRDAGQFSDVESWSGSGSLNYLFNSRLSVGIEANAGYDSISPPPNLTFESVQGMLSYRPGPKTSLSLSGGFEDQQFSGGAIPSNLSPVFSASLSYAALKATTLTITAARTVTPSFFGGQDTTSTSVTAAVQQGLSQHIGCTAAFSYGDSSYTALEPGPLPAFYFGTPAPTAPLTVVRSDTFSAFNLGLQYTFRAHISASAFYMYSHNSSSVGNFAFTSSQIGIRLSYRY